LTYKGVGFENEVVICVQLRVRGRRRGSFQERGVGAGRVHGILDLYPTFGVVLNQCKAIVRCRL